MKNIKVTMGLAAIFFMTGTPVSAQDNVQPVISYILKVDIADTTGYNIEIQVLHAPRSFTLAMATHHEYDDRFWRYVENFTVQTGTGKGSFVREDSAVWGINTPGNEVTVRYRIHLPGDYPYHPCHRPFLSRHGGLVGDIHSFMYMVGYEKAPAHVSFLLPTGWQIATGLAPTKHSNTFYVADARTLLDCPVFIGHLRSWNFTVNNTLHRVVYLPLPNAKEFDTALLVNSIKKIVEETAKLFGGFPYREYTFLLRDDTYGALEHSNSVTIGAPSGMLAKNMQELYGEIAHEFIHTWNLVNIKPAEYTDVNYGPQQQAAGLWFSEGFTMLYADLLVRRAGLPPDDSTRITHLEALTTRYFSDTGNTIIPPAKVSLASNGQPGMLGDYNASTHLQGELLGAMLDIIIRNATNNKQSVDGVMRTMYKRFGGTKGFYAQDVEQAVKEICSCDVHDFFEQYVYEGKPIDFNKYLELIGLQLHTAYMPAKDDKGNLFPDMRIYIFQPPGKAFFKLAVFTPNSCWGRAGLHTGDIIVAINNRPLTARDDFFTIMRNIHIGDTVTVDIKRDDRAQKITVPVNGYNTVVTHITALQNVTSQEKLLFEGWQKGE